MNDWYTHFEFQNFTPSAAQTKSLRKILEEIHWSSPSDSNVKIHVLKTNALFHAKCTINSASGQFSGQGISHQLNSALQLMESSISREINRWKMNRRFPTLTTVEETLGQRVS